MAGVSKDGHVAVTGAGVYEAEKPEYSIQEADWGIFTVQLDATDLVHEVSPGLDDGREGSPDDDLLQGVAKRRAGQGIRVLCALVAQVGGEVVEDARGHVNSFQLPPRHV